MSNTPFNVQQLLQMPLFREAEVIAGHGGLTNEIYYIDHMETPDLTGWLRPNELILTTGYSFRHEPRMLCVLLDEMYKVGGSAVGIKTRRFLQEVPEEAIYKSNLYNIPLFDIPLEVPFMDMTRSILDQILQRQTYMLRELQEVNQQFTNLVLNRRTAELVIMIGQLLKCEAAVFNPYGVIESSTPLFTKSETAVKYPILVGSRSFGYLAITRELGEKDGFEQRCLEHAVTVLALEFTIRQSHQLNLEREQEAFLVDLLTGSSHQDELLDYRAKRLGIQLSPLLYVMVIQASSSSPMDNETINRLSHWLLREINNPGSFARKGVEINGRILILCSSVPKDAANQRDENEQFAKNLLAKAKANGFPSDLRLTCGVGCLRERVSELSDSCLEARKALEIGNHCLPKQTVVHIHDVLVEQMLQDTADHPVLQTLYEEYIVPLEVYDQEFGANLLITLEAYLRLGSNTKQVAEELFIHRNSVLYRLERIRAILQKDLNNAEVHLRLELAVRLWKVKRIRG